MRVQCTECVRRWNDASDPFQGRLDHSHRHPLLAKTSCCHSRPTSTQLGSVILVRAHIGRNGRVFYNSRISVGSDRILFVSIDRRGMSELDDFSCFADTQLLMIVKPLDDLAESAHTRQWKRQARRLITLETSSHVADHFPSRHQTSFRSHSRWSRIHGQTRASLSSSARQERAPASYASSSLSFSRECGR